MTNYLNKIKDAGGGTNIYLEEYNKRIRGKKIYLVGDSAINRMTQAEIEAALGDSFISVSRGLVVNAEFIRKIGSRSCVLKDGREILLSRKKRDIIHDAYGEYVFSQLTHHKMQK